MFSAALLMRYEYHPPSLLSPSEPTRADRLQMSELGNCFMNILLCLMGVVLQEVQTIA